MEQPKSVKAVGILCAVFGFSGLLLLLPSVGLLMSDEIPPELASVVASIKVSVAVSAIYLPLMALTGVGLLMFKRWGWWLGMIYAVVAITGIAVISWYELSALPGAVALAEQQGAEAPVFSWGSKFVSLAIPLFTLYVLSKPTTREAFGVKQP